MADDPRAFGHPNRDARTPGALSPLAPKPSRGPEPPPVTLERHAHDPRRAVPTVQGPRTVSGDPLAPLHAGGLSVSKDQIHMLADASEPLAPTRAVSRALALGPKPSLTRGRIGPPRPAALALGPCASCFRVPVAQPSPRSRRPTHSDGSRSVSGPSGPANRCARTGVRRALETAARRGDAGDG